MLKLKKKIEFICDFCNTKPAIINGSIKNIEHTNEYYVHPRNMAYISDVYAHNTLVSESYTEEITIIQINLTYGLKDDKPYRVYYMQDKEGKNS